MSRRARSRAAAIEAKHYATEPAEDDEDEDEDCGPTCPSCGAEVPPDSDECWMCGEEL